MALACAACGLIGIHTYECPLEEYSITMSWMGERTAMNSTPESGMSAA
jgi:hypothetical protein